MTAMSRFVFSFSFLVIFTSCVSQGDYGKAKLNGVPGWLMDGAKIGDTPPPQAPDLLLDPVERSEGAIGFGFEERVETAEQAQARKKAVDDLFNR